MYLDKWNNVEDIKYQRSMPRWEETLKVQIFTARYKVINFSNTYIFLL